MPTAEIDLPAFSSIRIANIEPVLRELLVAHRAQLPALLTQPEPTWESLVVPLEEMHHRLARTWSVGLAGVHGEGAYWAQELFYSVIARLYDSGSLGGVGLVARLR